MCLSYSWAQSNLTDTVRVNAKMNKGQDIYLNKPIEAKLLWLDALDIIQPLIKSCRDSEVKNKLLTKQSDLFFNLSQIYRGEGKPEKTVFYLEKALEIDRQLNNLHNMSSSYNDLGLIYNDLGLFEKALEYYHKSLKLDQQLENYQGISTSLNNLGYLHYTQENFGMALDYFQQSFDIQKRNEDSVGMAVSYNNISTVHYSQEKFIESISCANQAINYARGQKAIGSMANSYSRIGSVYLEQKKYEKAKRNFFKGLKLRKKIKEKDGIFTSFISLSKLYQNQNQVDSAIAFAKDAYSIAEETKFPSHFKEASEQLSILYSKIGSYKLAFRFQKLHYQFENEIKQKNKSNQLFQKQYETKYESLREKDSLINLQKAAKLDAQIKQHDLLTEIRDKEHQISKKKNQQYLILFISFITILLIVIIFLVKNNQRKKKANAKINQQKDEVLKQKSMLEIVNMQLEGKNNEILDSITYAKRIQSALLPPSEELKEKLPNSFVLYKPKDIVAGDFYWLEVKDNKTLIAAADCTGHGVPGAMVSVFCNNGLNRSVREHSLTKPSEILDKTREIVISEFEKSEESVKDGMDIALCALDGFNLEYAGAHNPLWLIKSSTEELIEIKADKQPIGKFAHQASFTNHSIKLEKGDAFYLFSDGFSDQFGGEKGKKFKTKKFKELILSIQEFEMEKQCSILDDAFEKWKGDLEQLDDVCVIGIKV